MAGKGPDERPPAGAAHRVGEPQANLVPLCVRVASATALLGIGRTKLYELIAPRELETIRVGRRTLVLRASIDALIERLRT